LADPAREAFAVTAPGDEQIQWQVLEPAVFEAARRQDRLVLLFMMSSWDGANPMATTGHALSALVADRFVPVRVDPLRRPDIARRYAPAGWPALAVTLPDGRLVATATDIPKTNIHKYLLSLANHYRDRPDEMVSRVRAFHVPSSNPGGASSVTVPAVFADVAAAYDSIHGGFGTGAKFPETGVVQFLLSYYELHRDEQALNIALKSLEVLSSAPMWDEQEGGVLSYSFTPDWLSPISEKDAADQAGLLEALVHARQLTDETFNDSVTRLLAYIRGELFDVQKGVFYSRQVRHPRSGELSVWWTDPTVYTDRNALLILACLRAAGAEVEGPDSADMGLAAAAYVMEECVRPDGAVFHCVTESGPQVVGLLEDQVLAARALWEAYRVSGRDEFASATHRIVKWTETNLHDAGEHAFIDGQEDAAIPTWKQTIGFADEMVPAGNAMAATLYLQMGQEAMASELLSDRVFDPTVPRRSYASFGGALLQWQAATGESTR
jgi:uncharacterized protein YyaL (SSP411 family)